MKIHFYSFSATDGATVTAEIIDANDNTVAVWEGNLSCSEYEEEEVNYGSACDGDLTMIEQAGGDEVFITLRGDFCETDVEVCAERALVEYYKTHPIPKFLD